MALRMLAQLMGGLEQLRFEPTAKRVRALDGVHTVVDSAAALLVWEPRRIVPSYAVPVADVHGELVPATVDGGPGHPVHLGADGPPVYDPSTAFGVHTTAGEALDVRTGDHVLAGAAFRPADPELAGHVVLDYAAFTGWFEEDDEIVSHPRDPFHRVDIRHGSRHVRIELDGRLLADSTRPVLVFEHPLPPRFYLPPDDVRAELLQPSPTRTACAYKGRATYLAVEGGADVAWTYPEPLADAIELAGLVCFFDERVDVTVDGTPRPRPRTPWS